MDPFAGMSLGEYELDRPIGAGGMSQVWAARHVTSGEEVALKLFCAREHIDELARVRFTREAYATRNIAHPAIVPVLQVLDNDGSPALTMELLRGETLRARLESAGQLGVQQTAWLLLPVAEALHAAHTAGIVHRDLKPENIFIQQLSGGGSAVRLLDFGVARFFELPPGTEGAPITALGTLVGTLAYMAPEQALQPSSSDVRVDVWALGVVLYEALCGCRPIEGNTEPETLQQLLVGAITPLDVLAPELPKDLTEVVAAMLTRKLEKRLAGLELVTKILSRHAELA